MATPPPPPANLPPIVIKPQKSNSVSMAKPQSTLVARAQNSLSWRTSKAALRSFSLEVRGHELILECKPQTGESEMATGSTIWDCAVVTAKYLQEYCDEKPDGYWNGKTVLEVGSGTGVAGLACGILFTGSTLILTDMPVLTPLIQRNVTSNRERLGSALTENLSVQDFTWGTTPELNPPPPYDYIIVSDCVWPKIDNSLLVHSLRDITDLNTNIILVFEFRHISCRKTFFELAEQYFDFDCISEKKVFEYCPEDIEIYHIKRKPSDFPLSK